MTAINSSSISTLQGFRQGLRRRFVDVEVDALNGQKEAAPAVVVPDPLLAK
jgi:hypothetical protein